MAGLYLIYSICTTNSQGINSILFINVTKLQLYMGTKVALMTLWASCFWCWTLRCADHTTSKAYIVDFSLPRAHHMTPSRHEAVNKYIDCPLPTPLFFNPSPLCSRKAHD
jgi:hypothetical protein